MPVKLAKHGNAKEKNSSPYMHTSRPVLDKLKKNAPQQLAKGQWRNAFKRVEGPVVLKQWQMCPEIVSKHTPSIIRWEKKVKLMVASNPSVMSFMTY